MTRFPGINEDGTFQSSSVNQQIDVRAASKFVADLAQRTSTTFTAVDSFVESRAGVSIKSFGAVGDGVTDDTNALRAAFASKRRVWFDGAGVYRYTPTTSANRLVVASGTTLDFNGSSLYETESRGFESILVESNTHIDRLDVSIAGGDGSRGVTVQGTDIHIGSIKIVSRSMGGFGSFRNRAMSIGVENSPGTARVFINDIYIDNFDYGPAIYMSEDVTINHLTIRRYLQGLRILDGRRITINGGSADITSPNIQSNAGENAILIENRNHGAGGDIAIRDFRSLKSGEHGFRIGGQIPIKGVTFDNCYASLAGAGAPNPSGGGGGCGFKVLGATSFMNDRAKHSNIIFNNCVVESTFPSALVSTSENFAAFNIGKCRNVMLLNPVVRAGFNRMDDSNASYNDTTGISAYTGITIVSSGNISIISPTIENTAFAGIELYYHNGPSDQSWGGDPESIIVEGGLIHGCGRGIDIRSSNRSVRRVLINGLSINGGDFAVHNTGANIVRSYFDMNCIDQNGPSTNIIGCSGVQASLKGIFRAQGSSTGPEVANGSTFMDNTRSGGTLSIRKGGTWTAL